MTERTDGGTAERDVLAELIRAAGRRPAPRASDYERVLAASRAAWRAKLAARRRRWVYALAAGAAAAAVGLAAVLSSTPQASVARAAIVDGRVETFVTGTGVWAPLAAGESLAAGTRLRTVGAGRAAFELDGGASLRVSAATEWMLAGRARIELAAGTLYVDSGSAASAAGIAVVTPFGIVRDVGTQFEVRALSSGLRVRVREGLTRLEPTGGTPVVATAAGEQLTLDSDGRLQRRPVAADDAEWSWTQALASAPPLDGRPAFDVLTWIARESGKRLVFADAEAELAARGAVLHGDSSGLLPLELLDVVMATTGGLEYSLGSERLTVRTR